MGRPQLDPENTPGDLREELTQLEFAATQRELSPDERRRMEQLRGDAGELLEYSEDRAERLTRNDDMVTKGDDSP